MPRLFTRDFQLIVDGTEITTRLPSDFVGPPNPTEQNSESSPTLRVVFDVQRDLSSTSNKAKIVIYNLRDETRKKFENKNAEIQLKAGYINTAGEIYFGRISRVENTWTGTDWVTTIASGDGLAAMQNDRVSKSYPPGEDISRILLDMGKQTTLGLGNVPSKANQLEYRGSKSKFDNGYAVHGKWIDEFRDIIDTVGAEFSIQSEKIQVLTTAKDVLSRAPDSKSQSIERRPFLDPDTGLVGSPHMSEEGVAKFITLLRPDLVPGIAVDLESRLIKGSFRVQKVRHKGDTWGGDGSWNSEVEGKAL
jgi:hypothetical protein